RVQEAELNPGDTLQVGPIIFVVQIDGVPADEELQPVVTAPEAVAEPGTEGASHLEPATAENQEPTHGEFDSIAILDAADSDLNPSIEESAIGEAALEQLKAEDASAPDHKVQQ